MSGIIYIHVPKCGGSSFGAALRLRYLASQAVISLDQGDRFLTGPARIESDYAARAQQLRALVARGKRMISGHVRYDRELHDGPARAYRFVTLLRDPAERFVSHYNYLQRKHPDPARPATLAGFLDTEDALRIGSQFLYYFGGVSRAAAPDLAAAVARASDNLGRFDLIGDLARPADFARQLRRLTGGPVPLWQRNSAPEPTRIPKDLRRRIEEVCAPDMAIYASLRSGRSEAA